MANDPARSVPLTHPMRAGLRAPLTLTCSCGELRTFQATHDLPADLNKAGWSWAAATSTAVRSTRA